MILHDLLPSIPDLSCILVEKMSFEVYDGNDNQVLDGSEYDPYSYDPYAAEDYGEEPNYAYDTTPKQYQVNSSHVHTIPSTHHPHQHSGNVPSRSSSLAASSSTNLTRSRQPIKSALKQTSPVHSAGYPTSHSQRRINTPPQSSTPTGSTGSRTPIRTPVQSSNSLAKASSRGIVNGSGGSGDIRRRIVSDSPSLSSASMSKRIGNGVETEKDQLLADASLSSPYHTDKRSISEEKGPVFTQAELIGLVLLLIMFGVVFYPVWKFYQNIPPNWRELGK